SPRAGHNSSMHKDSHTITLPPLLGLIAPPPPPPIIADDDVTDIATQPATAPTEVDAPASSPDQAPARARRGTIKLNNGTTIEGHIWTTLATPLRVWVEEIKRYRDVDLSLIKRIDVKVLSAKMEDDWRWLKEGSDVKIYSGKKYPNVELAYQFTLLNDQTLEGTVVAPIYTLNNDKRHTLALYKKYHGKLDETLNDITYITSIELTPPTATIIEANEKKTKKLPLIY
ncbi:MAG: hypothetical protein FWD53_06305, partial [Phycisphaerales bacterium]|nr:hypothetical protein [Phycisphaerales bacterium]